MYSQPMPYGYPAPTYPGAAQPYYPGTVVPGTVAPGGASLGTPTFEGTTPSDGGNAPFYPSGSNTGNRPVPEYPGTSDPYYQDPGASSSSGASSSMNSDSAAGSTDGEQWQLPTTNAKDISFTREVNSISELPYAYDTAGLRWLQGVVSFDSQDKSWGIVYSINPEASVPYAGYLTLADDPRLKSLKDGDVVRIEGEISPVQRDSANRPMYVVRTITPISR